MANFLCQAKLGRSSSAWHDAVEACRKTTCIAPAWQLIPWEKPLPIITGGLLFQIQAGPSD
jgi:hypothetical protein